MRTLTKTITVRAPASKVWEVLTSPRLIPEWADSFSPGATAESDWLPGSEVVWTGDNGMVMRGQVTESTPDQTLRVTSRPARRRTRTSTRSRASPSNPRAIRPS